MNAPVPAAARLWQLALGFTHTAVLHALVETGVIEELGEQPKRLEPLAAACRLDQDVLLGGRERTENELRELWRSVGLSLNRVLPTGSPLQVLEVSR